MPLRPRGVDVGSDHTKTSGVNTYFMPHSENGSAIYCSTTSWYHKPVMALDFVVTLEGLKLLVFENKSLTTHEVITLAVLDAQEWQATQTEITPSSRNSPKEPPPLPNFENESLVCFVDAVWDATTRNCGISGVFKGREQEKYQGFKDSRRYIDLALIVEAL